MRTKDNAGLELAIRMVQAMKPRPTDDPKREPAYINLIQLINMAKASFDKAKYVCYAADMARMEAEKMLRELEVRKEILEVDLGIAAEYDEEPEEDESA